MKPVPTLLAAVFATACAVGASAQTPAATDHAAQHAPSTAAAAAAEPTNDGEVRKVDKAQGKLTLKHGPIQHLEMPGMTMVFKVSDPRLLEGLKPGDKVKFAADNLQGALTVTAIQVLR